MVFIGIDFTDIKIIEAIEDCTFDLESKFQAFISWHFYLERQGDEMKNPNAVLVQAFRGQWQPIRWKDDYLLVPGSESLEMKMREKLSSISYFRCVAFEIKPNSNYIFFFQDGRMIWELDLKDGLEMSNEALINKFEEKACSNLFQWLNDRLSTS